MASVLGPKVSLRIEGYPVSKRILDFVTSVKTELARDKADLITINLLNPLSMEPGKQRTSELPFTSHRAFAPGNVVEVFHSYDDEEPQFVQAGIIQKNNPQFPREGQPTITLKAFDASILLMNGTENVSSKRARQFGGGAGARLTLSEIAHAILSEYGFDVSRVDTQTETPTPAVATYKGEGKSDYQLIVGMANTLGWEFYVEWDIDKRRWSAVFRPPQKDDSRKVRFTWGPDWEHNGRVGGILHEFDPEFSIMNTPSDVKVFYYDEGSRTWEQITWPPERTKSGKPKKKKFSWRGDDTSIAEDLAAVSSADDARGLRIQAGGEAIEVVPKTGLKSAKDAVEFARAWFEARMELLIQGTGAVTGVPFLRPSQTHELQGLGAGYSGDWFFTEVTHLYQSGGGVSVYECSFLANKVIP